MKNLPFALNREGPELFTLGSSGGSYCTIQSTAGMSSPLAATSVHSKMASLALQNWKKVCVLLVCFCLPCTHNHTQKHGSNYRVWIPYSAVSNHQTAFIFQVFSSTNHNTNWAWWKAVYSIHVNTTKSLKMNQKKVWTCSYGALRFIVWAKHNIIHVYGSIFHQIRYKEFFVTGDCC